MSSEKFVLIDTDAGTDDALAILMCLKAHASPSVNIKVVGITCVGGNTKVENVLQNVTRLLDVTGLTNVPVFRGCEAPIVFPYIDKLPPPPFHGYDGFGDVFPAIKPRVHPEHGVQAIIRIAHEYEGKLTVLALGPHTNLAMAIRLDPSINDCFFEIYGMAGNIEGVGNVTVCSEFNFCYDPEAAFITLSSYTCPIIIVPWEVCLRQATRPMKWRKEVLGGVHSPEADMLNAIERELMSNEAWAEEYGGWVPCDQVAAAVLISSAVIKKSIKVHCTVELGGRHARGLMVVDYGNLLNQRKNVTVVSQIIPEVLEKAMLWGVTNDSDTCLPSTWLDS